MMSDVMNTRRALLAAVMAGLLGLVACQAPQNQPAPNQSPLNSPVATNRTNRILGTAGPTVTPDASKGQITGVIKLRSSGNVTPMPGLIVYLGDRVSDASGNKTGVSFDRINSMRAITDEGGRFFFFNVAPGEYGLVLDAVRDAYMLKNPATNADLLINVEAGKTVDFGELVYDQLPVTPVP